MKYTVDTITLIYEVPTLSLDDSLSKLMISTIDKLVGNDIRLISKFVSTYELDNTNTLVTCDAKVMCIAGTMMISDYKNYLSNIRNSLARSIEDYLIDNCIFIKKCVSVV